MLITMENFIFLHLVPVPVETGCWRIWRNGGIIGDASGKPWRCSYQLIIIRNELRTLENLLQVDSLVTSQMVKERISWTSRECRNQLKSMFKGIHFSTICDVSSESTCNIGYKVFKCPDFISDNYKSIGTHLHGFPDESPRIPLVHQILQHPVFIGSGTRWRKIKYSIVISTHSI